MIYKLLKNMASLRRGETIGHRNNDDRGIELDTTVSDLVPATEGRNMQRVTGVQTQDDMLCQTFNLPLLDSLDDLSKMASTDGHRSLGTTFFCGDATNSSIWQKQKVQGLLVSTSLITNWKALEETRYDDAFSGMTAMSHIFTKSTLFFLCGS